jgi:hypothetical protein
VTAATTVGGLLARCLRAAGARRVFGDAVLGAALSGLDAVPVTEAALAALLADCDGLLGPGPGCAFLPDRTLRLSSRPGGIAAAVHVADTAELPERVAQSAAPVAAGSATTALRLDLDLDAPAPVDAAPAPPMAAVERRAPVDPVDGPVVALAGPGVPRAGAVAGLHAFAAAAHVPVANTWGAKGVFPWDSPRHMGTAGLQAYDFDLLGFADAAMIVATGIDPDESPPERFALGPVVTVAPDDLSAGLARALTPSRRSIPANRLYERLSAVAQPGFVDAKVPLHPARAVADVRAALPSGGIATAQPGLAGLWMARTFPTTDPGTAVVPATVAPGTAAGVALTAALRGHPVVAIVDDPVDAATRELAARAPALGAGFVLDVWSFTSAPGSGVGRVDAHRDALAAAFADAAAGALGAAREVTWVRAEVSAGDVRLLVDAAGPVVAWGGLNLP